MKLFSLSRKKTFSFSGSLWLFFFLFLPAVAEAFEIQRWTLDNGAKVLFVARDTPQIVDIDITFDAGSRRDAPDKIGVADMANGLLDTGTAQYTEEILREKINGLAADISSYGGLERGGLRVRSLSGAAYLDAVVQTAAEILAEPRFDAAVLEREKARSIAALKQSLTRPDTVAARALTRLNYPDHVYGFGARETEAAIGAITRADLTAFHRRHYQAKNAVVAVIGAISREKAEEIAVRLTQGLPENGETLPETVPVALQAGQKQILPHSAHQAHIRIGMPLITRNDPDYYPLLVGNYILGGGGFDARLMKVLRDEKGYTYGVSSSMMPLAQAGAFTVAFATEKSRAQEALADAQKVLADFLADGPTEAELQQAKNNIIGGFPLRFDSNAKLLGYLGVIGFYGLPEDFLSAYTDKVAAVSAAQIREVWQRRVRAENLNIVVVGGSSEYEQ